MTGGLIRRAGLVVLALCLFALITFSTCSGDEPVKPPDPPVVTTTTVTQSTTTTESKLVQTLRFYAAFNDYRHWPDWYVWRAIGRCEQGGYAPEDDDIAWHGQRIGGLPGSEYPGGLGIMRAAWRENRVRAGVTTTNGALASPADQIRVARVVRQRFGLRAWECGKQLFPGER